jgi:DNA repair exonuclease SbcCD ATPase subunit
MSKLTMKQLKQEIEELRAEVEKLKRKDKYQWWEKPKKCPCCGKVERPNGPYSYPYYKEEY